MNKVIIIVMLLVTKICLSQTGIGTETPEADLDINYLTKFSNLPNVSNKFSEFNRFIYVDRDGYIGAKDRTREHLSYRTSLFQMMQRKQEFHFLNRLDLEQSIVVPPYTSVVVEINYSIPAMDGNQGDSSILLSKTVNNREIFLYEATRAFTYCRGYTSMTSMAGRSISNVHYDEVQNDTNSPKRIIYKLYGNTTNSRDTRFGMNTNLVVNGGNFGWGYGALNINVFDY